MTNLNVFCNKKWLKWMYFTHGHHLYTHCDRTSAFSTYIWRIWNGSESLYRKQHKQAVCTKLWESIMWMMSYMGLSSSYSNWFGSVLSANVCLSGTQSREQLAVHICQWNHSNYSSSALIHFLYFHSVCAFLIQNSMWLTLLFTHLVLSWGKKKWNSLSMYLAVFLCLAMPSKGHLTFRW